MMLWNAKQISARLGHHVTDNGFQKRLLIAAAAIMVAETTRRTIRRPETEKCTGSDEQQSTSHGLHGSSSVIPSFLQHMPSNMERSECEAAHEWVPKHLSKPRRSERTVSTLQARGAAAREDLRSKYAVQWKKPLGEGTFGNVYLVKNRKTGEHCALKKIPKQFTDNVSFKGEMDALLHLRDNGGHPHISGLRENFEEDDSYYLVLDLVSGGEMFDQLCERGAYSEADAARLFREVASALAFMHGIGVVHGDMKPENLMLSTENSSNAVVKVVDFGCAQVSVASGANNRGEASNTPAYSPPEILDPNRKNTIIEASFDMWALGVILYIMLTGTHPYDRLGDASEAEIENRILSGHMPPLRNAPLTAHLSPDAIEVVEQLMNWEPSNRLSALQLLANPWVRGETARTKKMADIDKRLSAYRAFKTKLGAKVFADMVAWSEEEGGNDAAKRTSLIERSFHLLDPGRKGYVTTADVRRRTKHNLGTGKKDGDDDDDDDDDDNAQLSLSGFSDLLGENMKNRYFPKGYVVYHEEDVGNVMYFINSGAVEVYTRDGFSKIIRKSGDFFGEGALMHAKKMRSASVKCDTPVHAIEISREYFEKYLATEEGTMLNLREIDRLRKRQRAKAVFLLQKNMKAKTLRKGEVVYHRGTKGGELYILESGKVELSVNNNAVVTVEPGEMCGEHALIMGRPRNVTATCITGECKVHALGARDFHSLLDSHPSLKSTVRDICLRRDFQKALCVHTKRAFPKTEKQLKAAFKAVDTKKTGVIELDEIQAMIINFDPLYTDEGVKEILESLDLNSSGTVTWKEFKRIFGMTE